MTFYSKSLSINTTYVTRYRLFFIFAILTLASNI